ncbi:PHP domain-containing protein [Candidatus Halobonum tyrrellensis]|uniref:PHP domain protein n=1 Tax=Candidatus Halobonum tyrrellensis G22 TaxID=1324957 RepID=V4HIP0_9EURY|nr:PHP domain-containing protein [Candidatus Halobonum tyrrellensis]ESP89658.1 PHP domain protein [Candidatus Halobonum tyrrellensis G22]
MLSVELHSHSELSHDGRDPVDLLLEQAAGVGLDALAVTDHDQLDASVDAAARADDYGLVGIPAMEVTSAAGHVLAFGIDEPVDPGQSYDDTLAAIRAAGGIAVIPHPFQKSRHGVAPHVSDEQLAGADAIEVYNSRLLTGRSNRQAREFALAHDVPMTAGSDAHIAEMVGQAVTEVGATERSVDAILDAIRDGRTSVVGQRTPWHVSFRQAAGGAKRRVQRRLSELI